MIGLPFDYSDKLISKDVKNNQKLFLKKYGSFIIMNGAMFLLKNTVHAVKPKPGRRTHNLVMSHSLKPRRHFSLLYHQLISLRLKLLAL